MKKPPRTYFLVEAALDDNGVPYLVADPRAPARKVGIKHASTKPEAPDHFAEHFELHAHIVDATDALHRAHFESEAKAGTLRILGRTTAGSPEEAHATLTPAEAPVVSVAAAKPHAHGAGSDGVDLAPQQAQARAEFNDREDRVPAEKE